tara:strand:+ start:27 stop:203 length:177 start_codon:yes stop_codon:yes gene_type:complete
MSQNKVSVAIRLSPDLIAKIDAVRQEYDIQTRTAFIEQAAELYALYLIDQVSKINKIS